MELMRHSERRSKVTLLLTLFGSSWARLYEVRLLESPPLEVLFVTAAFYSALVTLLTQRFGLVTFQSLCFASDAT